jgi:hypothetical protein
MFYVPSKNLVQLQYWWHGMFRISQTILGSCWCGIIFLNIHASTHNKTEHTKDSFYEELEHIRNKFSKYLTKNFRRL